MTLPQLMGQLLGEVRATRADNAASEKRIMGALEAIKGGVAAMQASVSKLGATVDIVLTHVADVNATVPNAADVAEIANNLHSLSSQVDSISAKAAAALPAAA